MSSQDMASAAALLLSIRVHPFTAVHLLPGPFPCQELRIACAAAQLEREGGISPFISPLAQVGDSCISSHHWSRWGTAAHPAPSAPSSRSGSSSESSNAWHSRMQNTCLSAGHVGWLADGPCGHTFPLKCIRMLHMFIRPRRVHGPGSGVPNAPSWRLITCSTPTPLADCLLTGA
jgi:hypothetical protein